VSKEGYYLPECLVQTGENCLTPSPPTDKNNCKKRKKNFKMLIDDLKNFLRHFFILKTYLGHIEVDDHSKTAKFFHSKYVFFAAKKNRLYFGRRLYFARRTGI
jgi:hypothetical protein